MGITVCIADQCRPLAEAEERWITQEVQRRRHAGERVCATVTINEPRIDVFLTTCPSGRGGRAPTAEEWRILDLWRKNGLSDPSWTHGNLVAFLAQLRRAL